MASATGYANVLYISVAKTLSIGSSIFVSTDRFDLLDSLNLKTNMITH